MIILCSKYHSICFCFPPRETAGCKSIVGISKLASLWRVEVVFQVLYQYLDLLVFNLRGVRQNSRGKNKFHESLGQCRPHAEGHANNLIRFWGVTFREREPVDFIWKIRRRAGTQSCFQISEALILVNATRRSPSRLTQCINAFVTLL